MKKNLIFLFVILFLFSCSSRKKQNTSTFMKGFSTYYNTLFNSKDALQTEIKNRKNAHQDNFYQPYIKLLTYEEQGLGSEVGNQGFFNDSPKGIGSPQEPEQPKKTATVLEIAEAKALKAISKYAVLKNGEEKNKKMFDAHLLLAQSRLYQNKPLETLDALSYIFTYMKKDKRLPLAKVYQGLAYSKMRDYYKANEVFFALDNADIKKEYKKLLSVHYAEMLLNSGKKEEAVEQLSKAFQVNKNRELRSRIAFLRGQVLANLGKNEEARESFVTAYKYANDFEFEVKSQVEIAKTFNGSPEDYSGAKDYLERISKKGTYASRKNEFYYALGLMANKAGKKEEAQEYFKKALGEKVSDPQIRGFTFYEIGKKYFDENDYLSAGAYYDSALAVMTHLPAKEELTELSSHIKTISKNYYLIKKNDSILALTRMSEGERIAYFTKFIDGIKQKEAKEELLKKQEERSRGFETGDYSANSVFANSSNTGFQDFGGAKGGFYFANQQSVAKGEAQFKQVWGNRALTDNWRSSSRMSNIGDLKNEALGITSVQNPRRLEPDFYIEKIPTDQLIISGLKKERDTASLGLGRKYEEFFSNTKLATKTLYDLVDAQPDSETKLQALYQIFAMNYEKNPSAAERAKNMILQDYPYTSYAEFVRNPKNTSFTKSSEEVETAYKQAFQLYSDGKYAESIALINASLQKYPKDALVPKFSLLNAFNAGKTAGKEIMILQLQQIALNYEKTPEGIKAKEMLNYLKSELDVELTDESGNAITPQNPPVATPANVPQEARLEPRKAESPRRIGVPTEEEARMPEEPVKTPKR